MSRLGYIARNPKRALTGLAALTVAAGVTIGSGAYFEDSQSINKNNSVTSGKVDIEVSGNRTPNTNFTSEDGNGPRDGAIFQLTDLIPGKPAISKRMKIDNFGTTDAYLQLCGKTSGDRQLLEQLQLKVKGANFGGSSIVYEGRLIDFGTKIADDENGTRRPLDKGNGFLYDFTVSFPDAGNQNDAQDESATAEFQWIARSSATAADAANCSNGVGYQGDN